MENDINKNSLNDTGIISQLANAIIDNTTENTNEDYVERVMKEAYFSMTTKI